MTYRFCPKCSSNEPIIKLTKESAIVRCAKCDRSYFITIADERWQEILGVSAVAKDGKTKG